MKKIILFWFKIQNANAAKKVLSQYYDRPAVKKIIHDYWKHYQESKPDLPKQPTLGGTIMIHLAAMSESFYQVLQKLGKNDQEATDLFYSIAWIVYKKMGKFSWRLAGLRSKNAFKRMKTATELFRKFPFNSPSYEWEEVKTEANIVGFNCVKCPVAEYFATKGHSAFCANTWCAFDYPLAEMWHAKLERGGSIAEGAKKCDFRWISEIAQKQS